MNNYGWICSRCSKSNAPHVNSCDCSPVQQAIPYYPYPVYPCPIQPVQPYTIPYNPYPWIPNYDYTITVYGTSVETTIQTLMYQGSTELVCQSQNTSTFMHNGT